MTTADAVNQQADAIEAFDISGRIDKLKKLGAKNTVESLRATIKFHLQPQPRQMLQQAQHQVRWAMTVVLHHLLSNGRKYSAVFDGRHPLSVPGRLEQGNRIEVAMCSSIRSSRSRTYSWPGIDGWRCNARFGNSFADESC